MKKRYIIILGKTYPRPDEEDWPTEENTMCTYTLNSKTALYCRMKMLIDSGAIPWWWIFDGDITNDNLILSGAVDPGDISIVKANLS